MDLGSRGWRHKHHDYRFARSWSTYEFVIVNVLSALGVLVAPATAFLVGVSGLIWVTVNIVGAMCAFQLGVSLGPNLWSDVWFQQFAGVQSYTAWRLTNISLHR